MAFDNTITLVGNVTADPDLVKANSGIMVCNFSVAWNPPPREGQTEDPDPTFVNVVAFRSLAENVAETVTKGTRVIVHGRVNQSRYESKKFHDSDGNAANLSSFEIYADDVAPSLRWASAAVTRNEKTGNGRADAQAANVAAIPADDTQPF